jgi:RNA polymerase sigma-70 factor (ECF subfamily)
MPDEIEALTDRIRHADADALANYIDRRRGALLGHIENRLGAGLRRKIEPEDIFQEVAAEAVRSLPTIDLGDRDPFAWLCQIVERRIIDAHRRFFGAAKRDAGREVALDKGSPADSRAQVIDMLIASMTTPSEVFSRNIRYQKLSEALSSLPDDQREALRLRYVEGLPSKQIAEQLKKSDGAVRVMLTRALTRLQSILAPRSSD